MRFRLSVTCKAQFIIFVNSLHPAQSCKYEYIAMQCLVLVLQCLTSVRREQQGLVCLQTFQSSVLSVNNVRLGTRDFYRVIVDSGCVLVSYHAWKSIANNLIVLV